MEKNRIEAFSDGVLAIIITIMVLELRVPHGQTLADLAGLWPVLLSYILSFVYVGIYWNNHHHLFQAVRRVSGGVLWANLHLLFWLSLLPFATGWMGENQFARAPVAVYGVVLLAAALAWAVLQRLLVRMDGGEGVLARAMAHDAKGRASAPAYLLGIVLALFVAPWAGFAAFVLVALLWLVPDRRIERLMGG